MMKYLPICTPPSLPINLMSLLCCDCLEGMRLEGHQGVLCVILAVRDWGWGAWCSSVCCWLWLAKKAWPKSVVSSSSSISRRLSCKKKDITNSSCFFVTFFQHLTNPNGRLNESWRTFFLSDLFWGFIEVVDRPVQVFVSRYKIKYLDTKCWILCLYLDSFFGEYLKSICI